MVRGCLIHGTFRGRATLLSDFAEDSQKIYAAGPISPATLRPYPSAIGRYRPMGAEGVNRPMGNRACAPVASIRRHT